jgi:hypothetical protein
LTAADRNYHSLTWLEYAYLQEGRVEEARQLLSTIELPVPRKHMRTIFAIETGEWDHSPADMDLSKGDLITNLSILNVKGLVAVAHGRMDEARSAAVEARTLMGSHGKTESQGAMTMPMGGEPPNTRKLAKIMMMQLDGVVLFADGKRDAGLRMLAAAAANEDALTFEFGPPTPPKPTHELYGELLLKAGEKKEAGEQFERSLQRAPGRRVSVTEMAGLL